MARVRFRSIGSSVFLAVWGYRTNDWDVNYGFYLVAQQKVNDLQGAGNSAIACRVSTVGQFNAALTQNGYITGDVMYFGRSGIADINPPPAQASEVFVGQGTGTNTNITYNNVNTLCPPPGCMINNYLSPNTAIRLYGCAAAYRMFDYYANAWTSIAQMIATQLNRGVYAYEVGTYFSNVVASQDQYSSGEGRQGPSTLPDYLIPEGAKGKKPGLVACVPNGGGYCTSTTMN